MSDPRITDEAVEAAAHSLYKSDGQGQWEHGELDLLLAYRDVARAALEAALPHLAPRPVEIVVDHRPGETCSVAASIDPDTGFARPPQPVDREALGKAIEQAASDVDLAKYFLPGTTDHFTDAVLALLNGGAS